MNAYTKNRMLRPPHTIQWKNDDICRNLYDMVLCHTKRTGSACSIADLERLAHAFHGFDVAVRTFVSLNPHLFEVHESTFVSPRVS